jgi:hypothetical protein
LKKMQSRLPAKLELKEFTIEKLQAKRRGHGLSLEDIGALISDEARAHGAEIDWISVLDPYAECDSGRSQPPKLSWERFNALLTVFPLPFGRVHGCVNREHDQEIQQRSRMRESCMSGSVRKASSDRRPYSTLLAWRRGDQRFKNRVAA